MITNQVLYQLKLLRLMKKYLMEHAQGNAPCIDGFADHSVRLLGRRAWYAGQDSNLRPTA